MTITKVLDGGPHSPLVVVPRHDATTKGALEEDQSELSIRDFLVHGHRLGVDRADATCQRGGKFKLVFARKILAVCTGLGCVLRNFG